MAGTVILRCFCTHKEQDRRYGQGNRVHNKIDKPPKHGMNNWRCSVCKSEKQ